VTVWTSRSSSRLVEMATCFTPSPTHARDVSQAKLLFSNELGFEPWIKRLLEASKFHGTHVMASDSARTFEERA